MRTSPSCVVAKRLFVTLFHLTWYAPAKVSYNEFKSNLDMIGTVKFLEILKNTNHRHNFFSNYHYTVYLLYVESLSKTEFTT